MKLLTTLLVTAAAAAVHAATYKVYNPFLTVIAQDGVQVFTDWNGVSGGKWFAPSEERAFLDANRRAYWYFNSNRTVTSIYSGLHPSLTLAENTATHFANKDNKTSAYINGNSGWNCTVDLRVEPKLRFSTMMFVTNANYTKAALVKVGNEARRIECDPMMVNVQ